MFAPWAERLDARALLGVAAFAAAGALAGYQLIPERQARAAAPVEVRVGGEPLRDGQPIRALALRAARAYLREPLLLQVGERTLRLNRASLGIRVDMERLQAMLAAARDPRSALRRMHGRDHPGEPLVLPITAQLTGHRALDKLLAIKDRVDRRVRDARLRLPQGEVLPGQDGLSLDVHGTLDAIEEALFRGESSVRAVIRRTPATRTADQLRKVDVSAVLGFFETRYSTLEEDRDRSFNLKVAAQAIDGLVLMPGETFDFNAVVGERSEANGFRVAPVIAAGQLVDGIGGGTCQIAGTLHAAVFFAGLAIEERSPHTRPSGYIKLGLDAAVSYPKLNLRFTNDTEHAVAVGVRAEGGRVRAEIRGSAADRRLVSFVRRIDEVIPYTARDREDPGLPQGVKVLAQRGVPGFKVTAFRVVRDLAQLTAVRERREDTYPPTEQIWRVGTGPAPSPDYVPPPGDAHSEYRADRYLILTQGPGVDGIQARRRAGDTGTPGWTARAGMPQVEPDGG